MLTYKLKIKNTIDVSELCENYSYMFRKLYANFELSQDKGFQKELREKYNLDSWIFESCRMEVKTKLSQQETFQKKNHKMIDCLEKELSDTEFTGIKSRRKKYKIIRKLRHAQSAVNRGITFGARTLLRKIGYLANTEDKEELQNTQQKYQQSRVLPFSVVGEAPQKSNRKFDFDLTNKKVIFKPEYPTKIPIEFYCSKGQQRQLDKLQAMIGEMPVSVRINNDYIYLIFDEEKLAGYAFNENEYFRELKIIPKHNKEKRKACSKKWIQEKEQRMFSDKIKNRYLSFDLNPQYIGFSILESEGEDKFRILHKECISFENLNTRLRLSSTDLKQVKQNNKRIHEISQVWKYIFGVAEHYKVAYCSMEDLDFKEKGINDNAKEANRQTKNLWHRERTTALVTKYCNISGIKLITVNACYSSFIGNIKYNYFDPVAASIEIGRRGITKYLKGFFYPTLGRSDIDSMCRLGLDVQCKTISTWKEAYNLFKTAKLRYRRELQNFVENNLLTYKSYVKRYVFNTI